VRSAFAGPGNIVGPFTYLASDVALGGYNVFDRHCSVGHHTRIGRANFFAPGCHLAYGVQVGSANLFGLGVSVAQGLSVGDGNRLQAGCALLEDVGDARLVFSGNRLKQLDLYSGKKG
jgi:UDP-3-O-[3-hydroxymyristoyl] glucosamine N-acyltransferase